MVQFSVWPKKIFFKSFCRRHARAIIVDLKDTKNVLFAKGSKEIKIMTLYFEKKVVGVYICVGLPMENMRYKTKC